MPDILPKFTPEQIIGFFLVVLLHGIALYILAHNRPLSTPDKTITVLVTLTSPPPAPLPTTPPARSHPTLPPKPTTRPPTLPLQPAPFVTETPMALPSPSVAPPPVVTETPPQITTTPPPLPLQPVMLSRELSVNCPERSPPHYPDVSIQLNEQGRVLLRVELDTHGRVSNVQIKRSSGHKRLDDAATNIVKTWHCKPTIRNGEPVAVVAHQPFVFELGEE